MVIEIFLFYYSSLFSMLCLMDLKIEIEWFEYNSKIAATTILTLTATTTEKRTWFVMSWWCLACMFQVLLTSGRDVRC